jgi:hypothetical protein
MQWRLQRQVGSDASITVLIMMITLKRMQSYRCKAAPCCSAVSSGEATRLMQDAE